MTSSSNENFSQCSTIRLETSTTIEYEEIIFVWKLKIFAPKNFKKEKVESPVFKGGEIGQHSWKLSYRYDIKPPYENYMVTDITLIGIGKPEFSSNGELKVTSFTNFVHPDGFQEHSSTQTEVETINFITAKVGSTFGCKSVLYSGLYPKSIQPCLHNDVLTIHCRILVKCETKHAPIFKSIMPRSVFSTWSKYDGEKKSEPVKSLSLMLETVLNTPDFADVHIVTQTKTIPAHKAILSARSPVFAAMFHSNFQETKENKVVINDFKSDVVSGMLEFMYKAKTSQIEEHSEELLQIADKYELLELKEECEQHLSINLKDENAVDILILATLHNAQMLKSVAINFIHENKRKIVGLESFKTLVESYPNIMIELYASL